MFKINIPTSPLPLREHTVRSKRDILFIKLESFTNSIMPKLRFSSLRKFRLCIFFTEGKLQFYQLHKSKTKKNAGSDGIWTQASQNITTNWVTDVNVNSSALMPIYFYRTLQSPLIFASVIFWSLSFKFFLSAYNETFRNILLSKRRLILLRDFSICICDEMSFFWLAD